MGYIETIAYDRFPKQKDKNYKYPEYAVGARVKVCFHYDTSKQCMGTIVRDDLEEPFETIIRLDDGRYLRAVECHYSYVTKGQRMSQQEAIKIFEKKNKCKKLIGKCWNLFPCIVCREKATITNERSEKFNFCDTCVMKELFRKLKNYEDAEKQGLLVKLPCRAGDVVYVNLSMENLYVTECEVVSIMVSKRHIEIHVEPVGKSCCYYRFYKGDFGKRIFLEKSEAEQELEKLESEGENETY